MPSFSSSSFLLLIILTYLYMSLGWDFVAFLRRNLTKYNIGSIPLCLSKSFIRLSSCCALCSHSMMAKPKLIWRSPWRKKKQPSSSTSLATKISKTSRIGVSKKDSNRMRSSSSNDLQHISMKIEFQIFILILYTAVFVSCDIGKLILFPILYLLTEVVLVA